MSMAASELHVIDNLCNCMILITTCTKRNLRELIRNIQNADL